MDDKYTFPADFDPHFAVYALKGLSEMMEWFHVEGPGISRSLPSGQHASIMGLNWLNRIVANQLYDYFGALSEAGVDLPDCDAELEKHEINRVKEECAVYLVQ